MLTFTILMVAGIGVASLVLWQKERTHKSGAEFEKQRGPQERSVLSLRLGDVVQHLEKDYLIEGKLTYNDEGFVWHEYLLVDRGDQVWLSVEQDERLVVGLFRVVSDLPITGTPPEVITYQGVDYRLRDRGGASMTRQGEVPSYTQERCRYFDYAGPGGKLLTVEQWGEVVAVAVGEEIRESILTILPGS
jgi:hypothetical protein